MCSKAFLFSVIVFVSSLVVGCRDGVDFVVQTVVSQSPNTPTITPLVSTASPTHLAAAPTAIGSATPRITALTTPTAVLTPTPLPPIALPPLLQRSPELGIRWGAREQFEEIVSGRQPYLVTRVGNSLQIREVRQQNLLTTLPLANFQQFSDAVGDQFYLVQQTSDEETAVLLFDVGKNSLLWETTVPLPQVTAVFADPDGLVLTNGDQILRLSAQGELVWQRPFPCNPYQAAPFVQDLIPFWCEGELVLVDPASGVAQQTHDAIGGNGTPFLSANSLTNQVAYQLVNVADRGTRHQIRGVGLEQGTVLWQQPASPSQMWTLRFYNDLLIFSTDYSVQAIQAQTGQLVWQTAVSSRILNHFLLTDQWLFVGSEHGYLYLLNPTTGELLWEQDLWEALEPRSMRIKPLLLTDEQLLVEIDAGLFSLGQSETAVWPTPTPKPTAITTPRPTETPIPLYVTPPANLSPAPPPILADWPTAIVDFLNAHPNNINQLQTLLDSWTDAAKPQLYLKVKVETADLNEDSLPELLLMGNVDYLSHNAWDWQDKSWVGIIQKDSVGHYHLALQQPATFTHKHFRLDLNNDGLAEWIYQEETYTTRCVGIRLVPVWWSGSAFITIAKDEITNICYGEPEFKNLVGDDTLEITFSDNYGGAIARYARGIRKSYQWTEEGYILYERVILPTHPLHYVEDANKHLQDNKPRPAMASLQTFFDTFEATNAYTENWIAFAQFQLLLAYIQAGELEAAAGVANDNAYPDAFYSHIKQQFWQSYQANNQNWHFAATATRKQLRLAGYEAMQITPYDAVLYDGIYFELFEIVPCSTCPQERIHPFQLFDIFEWQ